MLETSWLWIVLAIRSFTRRLEKKSGASLVYIYIYIYDRNSFVDSEESTGNIAKTFKKASSEPSQARSSN